jgi:carbon-monoxide dehydrogenase medium subunit
MYPGPFDYHRAHSFHEAAKLLATLGPDAKAIAGGQTLIPMMKLRLLKPLHLVDIGRIAEARGVRVVGSTLEIGALTPHQTVANAVQAREFPILKDCAGGIADAQVRTLGTIAGSLAEADPSSCWPTLLSALDARVRCVSPGGERVQTVRALLKDAYSPALGPAELISAVIIDIEALRGAGAFVAFKRAAAAYPTASCALQLRLQEDRVRLGQLALGCVGMTPIVVDIQSAVAGERMAPGMAARIEDLAAAAAQPLSDNKGSESYKRSLVRGLVRRACRIAFARATGASSVPPTHTYYG